MRLGLAAGASAAVVLSSPFVGQLRAALQAELPGYYRGIIVAVVVLAIGGALAFAVPRIRDRRRLRFGALAAALAIGVSYARIISTGTPDVDAVERFHFVEYGLLALLFYRVWQPSGGAAAFVLPIGAGLVVAFADEWVQWFVPLRYGDLRDVLLNGVALLCGVLFGLAVEPPPRPGGQPLPSARVMAGIASAAIVAAALFVASVHLGYEVSDADAGRFRSRYPADMLAAHAADRAARWRDGAPDVGPGFSREDQYLAEGLWHLQRRNEALAAGDRRAAWHENRILEAFYAPVLDLGSRWSPEARADIAESRPREDSVYVSDAEFHPIYVIPRPLFWGVVGLMLAGIWAAVRVQAVAAAPGAPV